VHHGLVQRRACVEHRGARELPDVRRLLATGASAWRCPSSALPPIKGPENALRADEAATSNFNSARDYAGREQPAVTGYQFPTGGGPPAPDGTRDHHMRAIEDFDAFPSQPKTLDTSPWPL
jgi:hypothetical protein